MCLILLVVFAVMAVQAFAAAADWTFGTLYTLIALFFLWLLQNNIKAILIHKGRCSPGGCSLLALLKRADKKPKDQKLGQ